MLWQDSSYDSSSSEDYLDELLLESMFPQQNDANYPRINLQDIPDVQCQAMFRYKFLRLWSSVEQLSFMLANFISASCIYTYKSSLSIWDFQKDVWEDSGKHYNCQPITFALKGLLLLRWRHWWFFYEDWRTLIGGEIWCPFSGEQYQNWGWYLTRQNCCLYSPFILPFLNLTRGCREHSTFCVCLLDSCLFLDLEVKLREKFNSPYS